jgi:hypothetical protein
MRLFNEEMNRQNHDLTLNVSFLQDTTQKHTLNLTLHSNDILAL